MAKISELRNDYINHVYPNKCPICDGRLKSSTSRTSYKDQCNNGHIFWFFKDSKTISLHFSKEFLRPASFSFNRHRGMLLYNDGFIDSIKICCEDLELYQCDDYLTQLIQNAQIL